VKKCITIAVLLIVLAAAVSAAGQEYSPEKAAVKKAIHDHYKEGKVKNDPKYFDQLLHKDWHFHTMDHGNLRILDKAEYLSQYDPSKADPDIEWTLEFLTVEVDGNVGFAKFKLDFQTAHYIDYFSLMKLDGKWWVVHKMSRYVRNQD